MIGVSISNRLIVHDVKNARLCLTQDVFDWLVTNVGMGSRLGGWSPDCDWLWCWNADNFLEAIVVINDASKATLFKLTWGGNQ